MKKGLFAFLAAVLVTFVGFTAAFAAELNANEQKVYDEFCAVIDKYDVANGGWLATAHATQYKEEARSALLNENVDLDETAYGEFSAVIKEIDPILAECKTQGDAWKHYDEIVGKVNGVANKYKMKVYVDADDKEAHVTVTGSKGSSTVAKSGGTVVKQTGFNLAQTGIVAGAAAIVLCGAFFVANKSKLFA